MYRLSIIVPLLGDSEQFEDTLVSVLQNRPQDCEVLVVHRGTYADPYQLQDEVRFLEVEDGSELTAMFDDGCHEAAGEIIHFLLPGVLAQQDWAEPALERFEDPDVAAVSPVVLQANDPDRVVSAGLRLTPGGRRVANGLGKRVERCRRVFRRKVLGPALAAGFYRKSAIDELGGLDERSGSLWADIDCGLSLQALGYRCVLEPESVVHGPSVPDESSLGFAEGRRAERVFWRHVSARGWVPSLIFHPMAVAATVVRAWNQLSGYTQLLGRLVSLLGIPSHLSHGSRLRERAGDLDGESAVLDPDDGEFDSQRLERPERSGTPERRRRAA